MSAAFSTEFKTKPLGRRSKALCDNACRPSGPGRTGRGAQERQPHLDMLTAWHRSQNTAAAFARRPKEKIRADPVGARDRGRGRPYGPTPQRGQNHPRLSPHPRRARLGPWAGACAMQQVICWKPYLATRSIALDGTHHQRHHHTTTQTDNRLAGSLLRDHAHGYRETRCPQVFDPVLYHKGNPVKPRASACRSAYNIIKDSGGGHAGRNAPIRGRGRVHHSTFVTAPGAGDRNGHDRRHSNRATVLFRDVAKRTPCAQRRAQSLML